MAYWDPLQLQCFALSNEYFIDFHSICTIAGSEKVTFMPHYQMVAAEVAFDKLQSPHE